MRRLGSLVREVEDRGERVRDVARGGEGPANHLRGMAFLTHSWNHRRET